MVEGGSRRIVMPVHGLGFGAKSFGYHPADHRPKGFAMSASEEFHQPVADRPPTKDEAAAAEAIAAEVDIESVAAAFDRQNKLGANVKGEGQIEPEAD